MAVTLSYEVCGSEFEHCQAHVSDRNYCSVECWQRRERPTGEDHHRYNRQTVPCDWCGAELERTPYRLEQYEHQSCDLECKGNWTSANVGGDQHPQSKRVTVACAYCGSELSRTRHRIKRADRQFCDRECRGNWRSKHVSGKNHPNWDGGYPDDYGGDWPYYRRAARERDDRECWLCGRTDGENKAITGRELSVHHITPLTQFDDARTPTACRTC